MLPTEQALSLLKAACPWGGGVGFLGFRVQGLRFRVLGLGSRVLGLKGLKFGV